MTRSDWGRQTRHGLLWSAASLLGNKAVNFISVLVLARLLAPSQFGVVAAVLVFLSFIELGSDLGMKATVVYEQERGVTERVQSAFTLNLIIAVVLTAVGVALAPAVADFFNVPDEDDLFRLGALSLLFTGLGNIHDALLLRGLDFKRRTLPQIARAAVRAVVSIGFAVAGFGAEALVFGLLAGAVGWMVVQWVVSPFRPTLELDRDIVRSMAGYGSAAALLEMLAVVSTRLDAIVVGRVLGERALGLYTIAFRVPELLIESVAWNTSQVAFPALSRKRISDRSDLARATLRLVRFQALYALPVAAGLAMVATPLIVVLFGTKWQSAGGVAAAVAVMAGISATIFPLGDVFKALGRQRVLVGMQLVQLPVLVGAMVLAAPAGIVTVAWVRAGVRGVYAVVLVALVLRTLDTRGRVLLRAVGPALVATAGVVAGAGLARVAVDGADLDALVAGAAAGALGGLAALRLLAPSATRDLWTQLARIAGRSGARPDRPGERGWDVRSPGGGSVPAILLGGRETAVPVCRSLGRAGIPVVAYGEEGEPVADSRYCDRFVSVRGDDLEREWLELLLAEQTPGVLLPVSDHGVETVARHREALRAHGHLPFDGDDEVTLAMLDKGRSYEIADRAGIPTPGSAVLPAGADVRAALDGLAFPCGLKPLEGHVFRERTGIVEKVIETTGPDELVATAEPWLRDGLGLMATEIVPGADDQIYALFTYVDEAGEPLFAFTNRKLRQDPPHFGVGCYVRHEEQPEVETLGLRFLEAAGYRGIAHVEFKRDPRDGRFKLIECNPRFNLSIALLIASGLDLPLLAYRRLLGRAGPPLEVSRPNLHLWHPGADLRSARMLRREGELTWRRWARSLLHRQRFTLMARDDPRPALRATARALSAALRRRMRRLPGRGERR